VISDHEARARISIEHGCNEIKHVRTMRTTIDKIAEEDDDRVPFLASGNMIENCFEQIGTAVNVGNRINVRQRTSLPGRNYAAAACKRLKPKGRERNAQSGLIGLIRGSFAFRHHRKSDSGIKGHD